jgi:type I restriction enzyme, S subunit
MDTTPSDWQEIHLGDVVQIKHGWPFKSECFCEWTPGFPVVVNIGNFQYTGGFRFETTQLKGYRGEYPKDYDLSPGDILLVMPCQTPGGEILGIPGRITDDGHRYLHNQRMGKLVVTRPDLIDTDYLYWVFLWSEFNRELVASSSGTKIVHTAPTRIEAFRFSRPPLGEQRTIARILRSLDDKVELNRRMNRTLEAIVQALFKSWFVDFEPVSAKREGRKPVGLDDATAALFPEHFQETDVGPIPTGWRISSIYDAVEVIYGAPFSSALFNSNGEGKPLTRIRDLDTENPSVFTTEAHPKGYMIQPGDIVVGMDGEFKAYLWGGTTSWLNQRVCVFVPKPPFSAPYVRSNIVPLLAEIEATETATTVIHLGKNDIDRFKIIVPDEDVLNAFNRVCQPCYDRIVKNKQQSRILSAQRDILLPQLLSGELRIEAAEKLMGDS